MRSVAILGSTGSIGRQALEVIAAAPDGFRVRSLAARADVETLAAQVDVFRPDLVAVVDGAAAAELRARVPDAEVLDGSEALERLAGDREADVVLNAVVGAAGLPATLAALDASRTVALANKESCVAAGPLVSRRLAAGRGALVPVDSEHASTHMCLAGERPDAVARLVLTASGGPFRGRSRSSLERVSPAEALAHPTWRMGPKITVDSATLMNKGLEVIEAHVLFGLDFDRIEVVGHPQSVVHCLVGFVDGSWKASMSRPDMRVPIAYALGYPERPAWGAPDVAWAAVGPLSFEEVDTETFSCLPMAYDAGRVGGTAPAVLNAANEAAVQAFLRDELAFLRIPDVVRRVLSEGEEAELRYGDSAIELHDVLRADAWARERARGLIAS